MVVGPVPQQFSPPHIKISPLAVAYDPIFLLWLLHFVNPPGAFHGLAMTHFNAYCTRTPIISIRPLGLWTVLAWHRYGRLLWGILLHLSKLPGTFWCGSQWPTCFTSSKTLRAEHVMNNEWPSAPPPFYDIRWPIVRFILRKKHGPPQML